MPLQFRNVDASPEDDVRTWPYDALATAIDRGLVPDWQPIFHEIRRLPWGRVARRVERIVASRPPEGASALFLLAIDRAMFAPIMDYRTLRGVGPRVAESGLGLIPGHAYSAPYEDVKLANR